MYQIQIQFLSSCIFVQHCMIQFTNHSNMQLDFLQRMKHVLTWAAIVSVTSASTRSRTPLFDHSVPIEQYTDTWVVQLLLPQSQLTLEAHTLATKHGLINQGQVEQTILLWSMQFYNLSARSITHTAQVHSGCTLFMAPVKVCGIIRIDLDLLHDSCIDNYLLMSCPNYRGQMYSHLHSLGSRPLENILNDLKLLNFTIHSSICIIM